MERTRRTLQEIGSAPPHPGVDVCLSSLDVVMEVVTECLYVRDDVLSSSDGKMAREENCGSC